MEKVFVRVNPRRTVQLRVTHPMKVLALLAVFALVVLALAELDANALCLLPMLALAAPLMLRRYPGARTLARLSATRAHRWQRARSSATPRPSARAATPRGGLLLACALAVRPPPRAALTAI